MIHRTAIFPKIIIFLFLLALFSSCENHKEITYFQKAPGDRDTVALAAAYVAKIEPGNILSIYMSSLNPAASSFFNPFAGGNTTQDETANVGANFDATSAVRLAKEGAPGYLVDQAGMIEIPLIGQLKVQGMSTLELRNIIREKLTKYLKEPTVYVRLVNFKISVMGEVNHPASYVIANEQISLPDAITMAGDLTIYGKRTNIMVIREVNGVKEFGSIDLTSRKLFTSPYYYLHPNDIVYVEPSKARGASADRSNALLPIVFSALSLLVVLVQTIHFK